MEYKWKDLPERLNCFTVKNTAMINLNNGKAIRHYATNTKINLVQKCVTPEKTYYRTADAAHHYLNFAFEASAFGLPDEKAPSAPSPKPNSLGKSTLKRSPETRTPRPAKKHTYTRQVAPSKDGERGQHFGWLKKIFRRKNA